MQTAAVLKVLVAIFRQLAPQQAPDTLAILSGAPALPAVCLDNHCRDQTPELKAIGN